MEKILYLVHTTNNNPENYTELRAAPTDLDDQFPGVYLSLITTDNVNIENIFPGRFVMLFSPNLLQQKNYHINIRDYNGFISESNTYYPWNLEKAINRIESYSKNSTSKWQSNEIVFHDNISMKYLCNILKRTKSFTLPETRCINQEPPDLTKLPFYVYSFEDKYTGADPLPQSSNAFYKKMARLAKLDPIPKTKDEIVTALREKAPFFLEHRNEQNIKALHNSGGYRKTRKTKRKST